MAWNGNIFKSLWLKAKSVLGRRTVAPQNGKGTGAISSSPPPKSSFFKEPRLIEHNGEKKTASEWADVLGVSPSTIRKRWRETGTIVPKETIYQPIADFKEVSLIKEDDSTYIEADGIRYSLYEFSQKYGIKLGTLCGRVKRGAPISEMLRLPVNPNHRDMNTPPTPPKVWEWGGEKHTAEEWAAKYGVKIATMRKRLRTYKSPEPNLEKLTKYKNNRARQLSWGGETHTVKEWADIYKVPERTMFGRWKKYNSPEPRISKKQELNVPSKSIVPEPAREDITERYWSDGESKTLSEWSEVYGLPEQEIRLNFETYGSPIKPACDIEDFEKLDNQESEGLIDKYLAETSENSPEIGLDKKSIHQWLEGIFDESDDGTPLREILAIQPDDLDICAGLLSQFPKAT